MKLSDALLFSLPLILFYGDDNITSYEFRNDPMFLRNQFKGVGMFNLPLVKRQNISLDSVELLGYDKLSENETDKIIHFFLDDNKFQSIYNQTDEKIETLKKYNNRDHRLPETNNNGQKNQYYEYDVNNRSSNAERDNQRFVRDDNGNVYYTDDHYDTFSKIK